MATTNGTAVNGGRGRLAWHDWEAEGSGSGTGAATGGQADLIRRLMVTRHQVSVSRVVARKAVSVRCLGSSTKRPLTADFSMRLDRTASISADPTGAR